jgi:hypothetical protein
LSNTTKTFAEVQKTEVELAKTEAVSIANSTTKKILQDYSTTDEVETKITASKESIELSVAEHLKSYVTTTTYESDIEIMSKEINSKVAEDDFGTRITQNAYNVKIAWNKNSNYIQFEENGITLYNGSIDDNKKRTVFDYNGEQFYRDGYYVGKIGTNVWDQDETHKGLVFDLNSQGKYMAFAQRQSEEGAYNTMLCFSRAGSIYNEYGIHLGCNLYGENFTLSKVNLSNFSVNGYSAPTGNLTVVTGISGIVDGVVNYTTTSFPVKNGILTAL